MSSWQRSRPRAQRGGRACRIRAGYHAVLAVNGGARSALASLGAGSRPLTAALRREAPCAGNPAPIPLPQRSSHMNTVITSLTSFQPSHSSAMQTALSTEVLRERVPAAFAPAAHERTSRAYAFISTERVLNALASAGFLPVEARQAAALIPNLRWTGVFQICPERQTLYGHRTKRRPLPPSRLARSSTSETFPWSLLAPAYRFRHRWGEIGRGLVNSW